MWLCACLSLLCVGYLLLTPPFQAPDEPNHFLRAYQLSTGEIWGRKEVTSAPFGIPLEHGGGYVPSVIARDVLLFSDLKAHPERSLRFTEWRDRLRESGRLDAESRHQMVFCAFPNTVTYPPMAYVPAALAIFVARVLGLSTICALYLARAFTMTSTLTLVAGALRLSGACRGRQLTVFCLAALPMTAFLIPTVSGESVLIALSLLVVVLALRLANSWSPSAFFAFLGASLALALCKPPGFVASLLILPSLLSSKEARWTRFGRGVAVIGTSVGVACLWLASVAHLDSPLRYDINGSLAAKDQMAFFVTHPFHASVSFGKEFLVHRAAEYGRSFIGVLGWLDTPVPDGARHGFVALLAFSLILGSRSDPECGGRRLRLVVWSLALSAASVYLVMLGAYLVWSKVGAYEVLGVQGRHFLPAAAVLFPTLSPAIKLSTRRYLVARAIIVLGWIACSIWVWRTLLLRYWGV